MKRLPKILPGLGIALALAGILTASLWPSRGQVAVEVGTVRRHDLVATVHATGMVIASQYTNVLGQGFGRITAILVHEGERVQPGEVLLKVEAVQAAATVRADRAALAGSEASLRAARAAVLGAQASVAQGHADLAKAWFNWNHGRQLYAAEVISRQDYENYRSAYDGAVASLAAARAQLAAARAERARAEGQFANRQATLARNEDVLRKTIYRAPIRGTVTNIAVRVGENVIPGVPDSTGAYLMTISDMTEAHVRVRVDENDILGVRDGQPATVQIDAFPGRSFAGRITAVGTQAIVAESGLSTAQLSGGATTQQATDFHVNITLDHPPARLRPGMTATAVVQTADKKNVIAVPFQALVMRPRQEAGRTTLPSAPAAAPVEIAAKTGPGGTAKPKRGVIGVFVVRLNRALFEPVKIGVLGERNVEIRAGIRTGERIVVGGYAALRELHSGMGVKIVKRGG